MRDMHRDIDITMQRERVKEELIEMIEKEMNVTERDRDRKKEKERDRQQERERFSDRHNN